MCGVSKIFQVLLKNVFILDMMYLSMHVLVNVFHAFRLLHKTLRLKRIAIAMLKSIQV